MYVDPAALRSIYPGGEYVAEAVALPEVVGEAEGVALAGDRDDVGEPHGIERQLRLVADFYLLRGSGGGDEKHEGESTDGSGCEASKPQGPD